MADPTYNDPDTLPDGKVVQLSMPMTPAEVSFLCALMESQVAQMYQRGVIDPAYRSRSESLQLRLRQAAEAARVLAAREIRESQQQMGEELAAQLKKSLGSSNRFELGKVRVVPYDPTKDEAARAQHEAQQKKDEEKH